MYFKIVDQGEVVMLGILINNTSTWCVKLYQNDRIPQDTDLASNYTEADFGGYEDDKILSNWNTPSHQYGIAQVTANAVTFTCDGTGSANTIYGYYVVDTASGKLLWAEYFDESQIIENNGDSITLTPKLTLSNADVGP